MNRIMMDSKYQRVNQPERHLYRTKILPTEEVIVDLMQESRKLVQSGTRTDINKYRSESIINETTKDVQFKSKPRINSARTDISFIELTDKEIDNYFEDPEILGEDSINSYAFPIRRKGEFNSMTLYDSMCNKSGQPPCPQLRRQLNGRVVRIRHRSLGPLELKPLAVALTINTKVKVVDLSGNTLGSLGARHIAQVLTENVYITELNLSNNCIGEYGSLSLCEALSLNRYLRILKLSGNKLGESDALYIYKMLMINTTIQVLDLSHNEFSVQGGVYLGKALAKNSYLKIVDLSWNRIRLKGAKAVCSSLKHNDSIETLNLRFNGLSDAGCRALKTSLACNSTLLSLDISCNRIHTQTFGNLLRALAKNTTLKSLRIGDNPLATTCATLLLNTILENDSCALQDLDLTHITVDDEFLELLNEVRTLKILNVVHDVSFNRGIVARDKEDICDFDLMEKVTEYLKDRNLRLVDMFRNLDVNGDNSLSKDEILDGLKMMDITATDGAVDIFLKKLDLDGDGEVDFGELLESHKHSRRKKLLKRLDREKQDYCEKETASLESENAEDEELFFLIDEAWKQPVQNCDNGSQSALPGSLPYTPTGKPLLSLRNVSKKNPTTSTLQQYLRRLSLSKN